MIAWATVGRALERRDAARRAYRDFDPDYYRALRRALRAQLPAAKAAAGGSVKSTCWDLRLITAMSLRFIRARRRMAAAPKRFIPDALKPFAGDA